MNKPRDEVKVLDHNYDGIQEMDNPLPNWWLATFYGAIVFSVLYVGYYHFGPGLSPEQNLSEEMAALHAFQKQNTAQSSGPDEALLAALIEDKSKMEIGSKIYGEKCASCHGPKGEGMIGPNLADAYWIQGDGGLVSIFQAVAEGVPDKGMPPWKALMKDDELNIVVAFVKQLEGTKPANPKAPQGVEIKRQ